MTASGVEAPILFGTNGWRGILAEDFSFPRLRRALVGVSRWFRQAGAGEVLVAHDTRFLGPEMAQLAARSLLAHGIDARLARGSTPTPAVTRGVRRRRAAGAVVLTASHNSARYQGLKVFGPSGGCIDDASARRVERWIAAAGDTGPDTGACVPSLDLRRPYLRDLHRCLDTERLARSRLRVAYDAMHGAGAGTLDEALTKAGVSVALLRADPDPGFGGGAPDPRAETLTRLRSEVRSTRRIRLGLATDGDADRLAVVDGDGRTLSETETLALLVDHLVRSGRVRRGLAVSLATGSLVTRVAEAHGLAVSHHPIGFKHVSQALLAGEADVAGDESGGFALGTFGVDKDGMLGACLMAESLASDSRPLRVRLAALRRQHGGGACGRHALAAGPRAGQRLAALQQNPPSRLDGARVRQARLADGLYLGLDDGFLMLRVSGTEPVVRVYAEAPGARRLRRRLEAGARLLGPGGARSESQ